MTDVKPDAKPAAHKYQPVKHDAHKAEAPRVEPPRLDAPKLDTHRPEAPKAEPAKPRRLKRVLIRFLLLFIVPLAAILAGAYIYLTGGRYAGTDDAYTKADMVQISADVSARVTKIEVKDNQRVKAGQVLFRLDDETFRIALEKAEAKLAHTRNDLTALQASYHQKETDLKAAQADQTYWTTEQGRQQKLAGEGFATKSIADQTRRSADMARQQVSGDQRALESIAAQLDGDPDLPIEQHASYKEALAERDQAALDLRHTVVAGPRRRHRRPGAQSPGRHLPECRHRGLQSGAHRPGLGRGQYEGDRPDLCQAGPERHRHHRHLSGPPVDGQGREPERHQRQRDVGAAAAERQRQLGEDRAAHSRAHRARAGQEGAAASAPA